MDIYPGSRWADELGTRLAKSNFGIVCVTPENSNAPWILFEAGALAKSLDSGRLIPLLLDMKSTDLKGPLSQFQGVETNIAGMKSLLLSLNRALPDEERMTDEMAAKIFEVWWPQLEERISKIVIKAPMSAEAPARSERELLEEILQISRRLGSRLGSDSESRELLTVSEMVAVLEEQLKLLERKESGIQAAEVAAERGGLSESDPYLVRIREALSQTWEEQTLYENAIKAQSDRVQQAPPHNRQ